MIRIPGKLSSTTNKRSLRDCTARIFSTLELKTQKSDGQNFFIDKTIYIYIYIYIYHFAGITLVNKGAVGNINFSIIQNSKV